MPQASSEFQFAKSLPDKPPTNEEAQRKRSHGLSAPRAGARGRQIAKTCSI